MFGAKRCNTILTKDRPSGPYLQYAVSTEIPSFDTTGFDEAQVPLFLHMEDYLGQSLGVVEVGDFTYVDPFHYQTNTLFPDVCRKRKAPNEQAALFHTPVKRSSHQYLRQRAEDDLRVCANAYSTTSQAPSSFYSSPDYRYALSGSYDGSPTQSIGLSTSPYPASYHAATAASPQRPPVQPRSFSATTYNPNASALKARRVASQCQLMRPSQAQTMPAPVIPTTPTLIRTSTLQPCTSLAPQASASCTSFNPYALYQHKAVLRIEGNLDNMADGWTPDEWNAKRRLVEFRRSQSGSTITTSFKAVTPDERQPNSICISCILWEEKQECYVTSVDTIHLLESLVAVRFTVEEKNRIRRNLEGFHPQTVSKGKASCDAFFKVIMGFPNPKPRNIEKDVKVFPWKILANALKKIIGKYVSHPYSETLYLAATDTCKSASYSSTASSLMPPVSGAYGTGATSEARIDHRLTPSPEPASIATSATTYNEGLSSLAMTPCTRIVSDTRSPLADHSSLLVSIPSQLATTQWNQDLQSSFYPTPRSAEGRSSWDFSVCGTDIPTTGAYWNPAGLPYRPSYAAPQQGSQQASMQMQYSETDQQDAKRRDSWC